MGKAAENEKIKLRAAFINNLATAFLITGFVVPYIALVASVSERAIKETPAGAPLSWERFRAAAALTNQVFLHDPKVWLLLFIAGLSVLFAWLFRKIANAVLDKMTD